MSETYDVTLPTLVAITALPASCFWRANCGTFLTLDGKRHVKANSQDGVADIIGSFRTRAIALETKSRTGKQRQSQRTFQTNWERAGGLYLIIRHPEEAVQALKALG